MSLPVTHSIAPLDAALTRALAAPGSSTVASAREPSPPKKSVESAWSTWQANAASSGSEFLQRVSSWTEGTAAQLLRPLWPAGVKRPTSAEIEERLRHNLRLAARRTHSTYLEALEWARHSVIVELRLAQGLPAGPLPSRAGADDHRRLR